MVGFWMNQTLMWRFFCLHGKVKFLQEVHAVISMEQMFTWHSDWWEKQLEDMLELMLTVWLFQIKILNLDIYYLL